MPTTLTPTTTPTPLTAGDRCDRCGAQAKVRAIMPGGGDLLFCGHHAKEYGERLRAVAVEIVDETARVDQERTSPREF